MWIETNAGVSSWHAVGAQEEFVSLYVWNVSDVTCLYFPGP